MILVDANLLLYAYHPRTWGHPLYDGSRLLAVFQVQVDESANGGRMKPRACPAMREHWNCGARWAISGFRKMPPRRDAAMTPDDCPAANRDRVAAIAGT
jgi:hypothetical protein